MMDFLENVFYSKLLWGTAVLLLFYIYLKQTVYFYWQKHGVPHEDFSIPLGMFDKQFLLRKLSIGNLIKQSYEKFKKHRFHGLYMFYNRVLMINDPELIKHVLIKDFNHFCDRGLYSNPEIDPLSGNMFLLNGCKWKTLRAKLSPSFTIRKLKQIFPILKVIALEMIKLSDKELSKSDILEMKDLAGRYTTDAIYNLAFGVNSNCLKEPNNNQFRYYQHLTVENYLIRNALAFFAPKILYALRQPFFGRPVIDFYLKLFQDMVDKRKQEKTRRGDFLDSLINLMDHEQTIDVKEAISTTEMNRGIHERLTPTEAASQAFVFIIAGYETSSSLTTYCLYELALNLDVQEKVYEELKKISDESHDLVYEDIMQLEYLEMVFCETMRKHASVPFLNRICTENYKIPNSNFTIPKGMSLIISVSGLHSDPDVYPNPDKFDPSRFSKENMATRHSCNYLPFGEGPRICIGKLLGILQSKLALFYLLSNYKFSVCDKTTIPNQYSLSSALQTPRSGIYLRVERRKIQ